MPGSKEPDQRLEVSVQKSARVLRGGLGEYAFKRPDVQGWRDQVLAGMFDAQMVAVTLADDQRINSMISRKSEVLQGTRDLFVDPQFENSVRVSTNTASRVHYRIDKVWDLASSF